jgi:ATP-dependent 26S proteasome regulatory subunit
MPDDKAASLTQALVDPNVPIGNRLRLLQGLVANQQPEAKAAVQAVLVAAAQTGDNELLAQRQQELQEIMEALEAGPQRIATFIKMMENYRAYVKLPDGNDALIAVPDAAIVETLTPGDDVLVAAKGEALLKRLGATTNIGEEAIFTRRVGTDRIEVQFSANEDSLVVNVSKEVLAELEENDEAKKLVPGRKMIVSRSRLFAFQSLPQEDKLAHYQFLSRETVPDILPDRDIGSPMAFLGEIQSHLKREMLKPELGRKYKLRRSIMKMLTGVSGSGKSLHLQAIWRQMYDLMSEITGCPVDQLPPRVLKLRSAQVLSKWLGESDKQLDRFFDEVEQIAAEPFEWKGKKFDLPVMVIMEEAEGLSRARGEDAIYDRIQTTMLQRLDATVNKNLKDKLIMFFSTSNVPQLIDPAFLRRAGGTIEHFTRLDRAGFMAVLEKHIAGLPVNGGSEKELIETVTSLVYPENDNPIVKLKFQGGGGESKCRKDFLTGAIIDRAVQQAADLACRSEHAGDKGGVSAEEIMAAINGQVQSLVKQLYAANAQNYLDIPDGVKVADVQKLVLPAAV